MKLKVKVAVILSGRDQVTVAEVLNLASEHTLTSEQRDTRQEYLRLMEQTQDIYAARHGKG